ncbi:SdpI family protein [Shouchella clausii]
MTVVLGYFGTKAKPNLAFGVRTKWALSNDEVWKRSNLLGGETPVNCRLCLYYYRLSCTVTIFVT